MKKIKDIILSVILCMSMTASLVLSAQASEADCVAVTEAVDCSAWVYQEGAVNGGPETPAMVGKMARGSGVINVEAVKEAILSGLKRKAAEIDLEDYRFTRDNLSVLSAIYAEVLNDNPQLFYVKGGFEYLTIMPAGIITKCMPQYDNTYRDEDVLIYEAAVQKALAVVRDDMTDLEKALALHDYLAQNCRYDLTYQNRNSYHVLVDGVAVCQGYSLAYGDLLKRINIGVDYVTSESMNHMWNCVELDGEWYHVDVTHDDPTPDTLGRSMHNNFLFSDEAFDDPEGHHDWESKYECNSPLYDDGGYWSYTNTAVQFDDQTQAVFLTSADNKIRLSKEDETELFTLDNDLWKPWGNHNSYYRGIYSYLSEYGGQYYFNDRLNVYRTRLSDTRPEVIYSYDGDDGYIYGMMVKAGDIYLDIAQNPNTVGSDIKRVELLDSAEAPTVTLNYYTETLSTTEAMEYSIDQGMHWNVCNVEMSASEFGWNGNEEVSILFRTAASEGYLSSDAVAVKIPKRPEIPDLRTTAESIQGKNDGSIAGVTALMEYRRDSEEWISCAGQLFDKAAPGNYQFRMAATATSFAGKEVSVTVNEGEPVEYRLLVQDLSFGTVPYEETISKEEVLNITNVGNSDVEISEIRFEKGLFEAEAGNPQVTVGDTNKTYVVRPGKFDSTGTFTDRLVVSYGDNEETSAEITIVIEKGIQEAPESPSAESIFVRSVVLKSIDHYEYSKDGILWQQSPIFHGLEADTQYTFYQRKAENALYKASPASEAITVRTLEDPRCEKHEYGRWQKDNDQHWQQCIVCEKTTDRSDHAWTEDRIIKEETFTEAGLREYTCECGAVKEEIIPKRDVLYEVKDISLSKMTFVYNGKVQKPTVTAKDSNGKTLTLNEDYEVTYIGGCKDPGSYTVKITFTGNYSGEEQLTFVIKPKAIAIASLKGAKKALQIKWKKASKISGYEIMFSKNKKFNQSKTVKVSGSAKSKKISKLSAKKKYYVKIRAYKTVKLNGKSVKIYSDWSKVKSIKTK